MKMDKVANSGNDEFYTPAYAVEPILKYIKPKSKIWCPFDEKESLFVKRFTQEGHNVTATHINNGEDFFKYKTPPPRLRIYNQQPPIFPQRGSFKQTVRNWETVCHVGRSGWAI